MRLVVIRNSFFICIIIALISYIGAIFVFNDNMYYQSLLGMVLNWATIFVFIIGYIWLVSVDISNNSITRVKIIYCLSMIAYIIGLLYVKYTSALNGYIVVIPAIITLVSLLSIILIIYVFNTKKTVKENLLTIVLPLIAITIITLLLLI
jgi:hypothetical protein